MEEDLYKSGDQKKAALNMLEHIESHLTHAKARECRCGLLESLRCRGRIKQRIASEISGELDFQRGGRQPCIFKPRPRAYQRCHAAGLTGRRYR